ncbi:hypothetical protein [Rariglobus hedericola]|uniref:Uncharacterized protein n=1 Tax=Rariglobus hedericola TaxID=2597822 RepID=A0A556QPJ7_9BACT|nr:hypothetical protein [Rariglobus hedericola]TSJ78561.1 hypothetical protein FPL22_04475 [Rariglobus hedericola]
MTSNSLHRLALVFALALVAGIAPARAVQFRLLAWGSYDLNLQFQNGKGAQELAVFPKSFSITYEIPQGPIVLFKTVEVDGKPQRQTACTIVVPPEIQQALVILVPADDSNAPYRKVLPNSQGLVSKEAALLYDCVVLDNSPAAHPVGTIEFRNFSRLPIAINIADRQLTLPPRDKTQVPITEGAKRMAFRAAAQLENGDWKLLSSSPLPISGAGRVLVILRDRPEKSSRPDEPNIAIVPLFDWTPPPSPEPVAPQQVSYRR